MLEDKLRPNAKVYGPYVNNKGYEFLSIVMPDKRISISYAKWIVEQHLGRFLEEVEQVDHIDRDHRNHSIGNLQVVKRGEHQKLDAIYVKSVTMVCSWCGESFESRSSKLRHNAKQGKAGPFCGRSCAGKYGASVQNGGPLVGRDLTPDAVFYRLDKKPS